MSQPSIMSLPLYREYVYAVAQRSRSDEERGPLPQGAKAILDARRHGRRPALPLVVSLCGRRDDVSNPQVLAWQAGHDWRFAAGLDCFVFTRPATKDLAQRILLELARVVKSLALWDIETKRGMDLWPIWRGVHRSELHHQLTIEEAANAIFVRWGRLTWLPGQNLRFAGEATWT